MSKVFQVIKKKKLLKKKKDQNFRGPGCTPDPLAQMPYLDSQAVCMLIKVGKRHRLSGRQSHSCFYLSIIPESEVMSSKGPVIVIKNIDTHMKYFNFTVPGFTVTKSSGRLIGDTKHARNTHPEIASGAFGGRLGIKSEFLGRSSESETQGPIAPFSLYCPQKPDLSKEVNMPHFVSFQ